MIQQEKYLFCHRNIFKARLEYYEYRSWNFSFPKNPVFQIYWTILQKSQNYIIYFQMINNFNVYNIFKNLITTDFYISAIILYAIYFFYHLAINIFNNWVNFYLPVIIVYNLLVFYHLEILLL